MTRGSIRLPLFLLLALAACSGGGSAPPGGTPDPLARALSDALAGAATVSAEVTPLGHRLREPIAAEAAGEVDPALCDLIEERLASGCAAALEAGLVPSCSASATFFWAHDVPRCAARVEVWSAVDTQVMSDLLAFDVSGTPRVGPPETCGDGEVQAAEGCDDGNHEAWDGCDPNCQPEPFSGCETVIEQEFQAAELAWVDRAEWRGPRSHLMVHDRASAIRAVTPSSCAESQTVAQAACDRIAADMPFVAWCWPETELVAGAASQRPACAVRLNVGFQRLDPDHGVFTTSLTGILAFTIR